MAPGGPAKACETHRHRHRLRSHNAVIRKAFSRKRNWRVRDPRRKAERRLIKHSRNCPRTIKGKRAMVKYASRKRGKYRQWRRAERRAYKRSRASWCAPSPHPQGAGCWVIPAWCVGRESGGRWSAHNPTSPARGPYQLNQHGEPWPVTTRSRAMAHHRIARDLYASRGLQPWVAC